MLSNFLNPFIITKSILFLKRPSAGIGLKTLLQVHIFWDNIITIVPKNKIMKK